MQFYLRKDTLSCLVLILCLYFSPIISAQTIITGVPGYTNVDNPVGTNTYNITSNKQFNGGAAILNRFTSFVLNNNHTANIILGAGVQTSVNVVNNPLGTPAIINGILNSIAGTNASGPKGGNFIFIDHNGFMIGSTGQINAGSILLSTSNRTFAPFVGGGQINLNSEAQDNLLNTNVVDINGKFSFYDMSGAAQIDGVLNTMSGNAPAGISPAVSVFANTIDLGATGMIFARNQTAVNLVTAKNVNYTFSSNSTTVLTALDNGGNLAIEGQVTGTDGKVLISANTLDLINNALNITGIVDASSLTHDSEGNIRLRSGISEQSSGEISLNNARVSASNNINIYTRKAININGAGTILNAGNDLMFSGNGMYLNGTYQTTLGDININNPGSSPLLIDADLTAQAGEINITTDGPLVLDYAESLLPANVVPADDQVSMASGNVSIMSNGFTSYASIISQGGDVSIESVGDAAFTGHCGINALNALNVLANTILVNQPFNTINGDIELNTRTGDIFLAANGMLSSLNGAVNIFRQLASKELRFTANGIISADGVANGLVVGDFPCGTDNGGPVVLDGSTFGVYSGTYNNSTVVPKNAQFNKNLFVNNFAVNIYGTTPSPVNPVPDHGGGNQQQGNTTPDNTPASNSSSTNTNSDDNNFAFTDLTLDELVGTAISALDTISDPATRGSDLGWNRFPVDIQEKIANRIQQGLIEG